MPSKKKTLLGENVRKIQPKLRVISNGSPEVNAVRAEQCGAVAIADEKILSEVSFAIHEEAAPIEAGELPKSAKRGHLEELPKSVLTNVFVQTIRPLPEGEKLPGETARRGNIVRQP